MGVATSTGIGIATSTGIGVGASTAIEVGEGVSGVSVTGGGKGTGSGSGTVSARRSSGPNETNEDKLRSWHSRFVMSNTPSVGPLIYTENCAHWVHVDSEQPAAVNLILPPSSLQRAR